MLFMDEQDFQQLDQELELEIMIVPQKTRAEQEELEQLEEMLENVTGAFSIGNLIFNLFLAFGLKYLWNMVSLLQFIVFMRTWQIMIPDTTDVFLKSLKTLALFEFLPTEKVTQAVKSWFTSDTECEENCQAQDSSTFDELGMVFIAGVAILIACLVLLVLAILVRKCPKLKGCYQGLKKKLAYGMPIRYLLLGTLKT